MDVSPKTLIQAYYDAAQDDPTILGALVDARTAALTGMLSKGGGNTLTNSQKNGISYSVLVSMPETTRITILNTAINWIRLGIRPASKTIGTMQNYDC
jgi:hypothetical protein